MDQNWHKDVDEPYKLFGGAGSFEEANAFVGLKDDAIVKALPFPQASPGALVFFALHDVPLRMGADRGDCRKPSVHSAGAPAGRCI